MGFALQWSRKEISGKHASVSIQCQSIRISKNTARTFKDEEQLLTYLDIVDRYVT